jgi:pyruvate dehydrogenase E1 component alpha subunit
MRPIQEYSKEQLLHFLHQMVLLRRFDERAGQVYGLRKIGGFCHLYIGQEAVAVGSIAAMDPKKDYLLTGYRDHGHALALGMSANSLMAEMYGKATGCSRGKGGSMHFFDKELNFLGGNGIVGAQIPIATGVAFATSYLKQDSVTLCFFGDGAIHQGAFHESLNIAKIWKLPVLYICENNEFGMGTAASRASSNTNFAELAPAYSMEGWTVDGMDVIAVYEETKKAISRIKETQSPILLDIKTYRYRGHSMSDPGTYRTKEEVEQFRKQDPIVLLKDEMAAQNLLSEAQFEEINEQVKKVVEESVHFAEQSPEPELHTLYDDVLA